MGGGQGGKGGVVKESGGTEEKKRRHGNEDDVTRRGGWVTSASKLLLNICDPADRIDCLCVSSLCPLPLPLSQELPLRVIHTKITRQFWGWSCFWAALSREHLSNSVLHCYLNLWRQQCFLYQLRMPFTHFTYL